MQPAYVVQDETLANGGQTIEITQGETKVVNVFMFKPDGGPLFVPGSISEITIKVFSQINQASIVKTLGDEEVTKISDETYGCFGFKFILTAEDTLSMASNNAGLPMKAIVDLGEGGIKEFDFLAVFQVLAPVLS